uniref:Dipeptidyl peptidase 1 n=1 Tax=Leptobrachium leishanense TaxID=445787 RepID=A0A8C5QEC6_9ANUR
MSLEKLCGLLLMLVAALTSRGAADTPANCSFPDLEGTWEFTVGQEKGGNSDIDCSRTVTGGTNHTVRLKELNVAEDELGNVGFFTLIYNQGFELDLNGYKWFAFFKYVKSAENITSYCHETLPGWVHNVLTKNWACFVGKKVTTSPRRVVNPVPFIEDEGRLSSRLFKHNAGFIEQINMIQSSWKARVYPEYQTMSLQDLIRRAGGKHSRIPSIPKPAPIPKDDKYQGLPPAFDWRKVNGYNFVSPVRNQGSCGSCYAFATMGMLESRLRVYTQLRQTPTLSPQQIVSCSNYSQGCDGGFPYLIAGKYGQDFGIVEEQNYPYTGKDSHCTLKDDSYRYYTSEYHYVGGFYGGCNEVLMKYELLMGGPLAVAFEVYDDFLHYSSGIYHHTGLQDKFNPFQLTNHAVLLVGYGHETTGEKYWIVKNSWGTEWGENGFFRIRRGNNECAIESIAVAAKPIPKL